MKLRQFISISVLALAAVVLPQLESSASQQSAQPNIVLIIADDMSWMDCGCYGNQWIETANIDTLSNQGVRFTDAYATPVCASTRACLQTGLYPARLQMTGVPNGHRRPWAKLIVPKIRWYLPEDNITLAESLAKAGYISGLFGKWHLGFQAPHSPTNQGYTVPEGRDQQTTYMSKTQAFIQENPYKRIDEHFQQGIRFIEQNKDHPFFCVFSFTMVHTPPMARKELVEKYRNKLGEMTSRIDPTYSAMCETVDESVGLINMVLDEFGLTENTVLIFYSDNGGVVNEEGYLGWGTLEPVGYESNVTVNLPLRDEKGSVYEGGIRVPLIIRWPGTVQPGSECRTPVHCVDFFPTLLELSGVGEPANQALDGESIVPLLKGSDSLQRDTLFWHYPHYHHSSPASAIREGDYKLIKFYEDNHVELYDLKNDISEQNNLSETMPEKTEALYQKLNRWLESVNAAMPTPNPDYDPNREQRWGARFHRELVREKYMELGL